MADDGAAIIALTALAWQPEKELDEPYDPDAEPPIVTSGAETAFAHDDGAAAADTYDNDADD